MPLQARYLSPAEIPSNSCIYAHRPQSPHRRTYRQHNLEALSREAEILQGWERLHPPPDVVATPVGARKPSPPAGPNIDTSTGQDPSPEGDSEVGAGGGGDVREGTAKGGRRRRKPAAAVELMIQ